jgi:hypothetical protein
MKQGPFYRGKRRSDGQQIPRLVCKSNIHYGAHNSLMQSENTALIRSGNNLH